MKCQVDEMACLRLLLSPSASSGLYYKHILTIVSDDHKWWQFYICNWRC